MSDQGHGAVIELDREHPGRRNQLFIARVGRFEEHGARATMDELTAWVEETYREELEARPSMHVYVRNLPDTIAAKVDRLRDSDVIISAIRGQLA